MSSAQETAVAGIRFRLFAQHMTQVQLAQRMGVTISWLQRRLDGKPALDTNDLDRIAAALGITFEQLFEIPAALAA